MGKFNNKIEAEFSPPKTWELSRALSYQNDEMEESPLQAVGIKCPASRITCKKGFKTDLASVPRACWAFIAPFDVARAAIVHDILYEKINMAFKAGTIKDREPYRLIADTMFKLAMKCSEPAVPGWKIWSAHSAVRLFGRFAIKNSQPRGDKPKA